MIQSGYILSFYAIGNVIGGILGGKLSQSLKPNLIIFFCLISESIVLFLLALVTNFQILILLGFLLGLSTYTLNTVNKVNVLKIIAEKTEEIKLKILSLFYASSNLGVGICALLVSFCVKYNFTYYLIFGGTLLSLLAIIILFKINNNQSTQELYKSRGAKTIGKTRKFGKNINVLGLILFCVFLIGIVISQLSSTYPLYLANTYPSLGVNAVSIPFTINAMMIMLFQTPVVNVFNQSNKIYMVGIGSFLMAASMVFLNLSCSYYGIALLAIIVYSIGEMLFFSMSQLVVYQHSDEEKKGSNIGLFQSILAVSVIIGPVLGSYTLNTYGPIILWNISGAIGVTILILTLFIKKYDIKTQN